MTTPTRYADVDGVDPEVLAVAREYERLSRTELRALRQEALALEDQRTFLAATYLITLDSIKRGM